MVSDKLDITKSLNEILPCYYELFCDSKVKLPCFTYIEYENYNTMTGDTLGYSSLGYTIKVWANDVADIDNYSDKADKVMREKGYRLISSNELVVDEQIEKVMNYEALGVERY
jgi:hypothetical protein